MSDSGVKTHDKFILPPSVVSRLDVSRLVSELERVDNELTGDSIRHKVDEGHEVVKPQLSEQLNDFLNANKLNLDNDHGRSELIKEVRLLKDHVPVIHMTFAVTADRESLATLMSWLRESVHAQVVVAIGLQPALVAGVYMRTPNHVHDFSMRARLKENHSKLVGVLEELRGGR